MKKGFLILCFSILSCIQFLHGLALEDPKLSKNLVVAGEKHETNGRGNDHSHTSRKDEEFFAKHHAVFPIKGQKGKGPNGGANVIYHPRPNEKNAAFMLQSPSAFISTNNFCIGFYFILILPMLIA